MSHRADKTTGVLPRLIRVNTSCADCSTKNPKYISTTFGVFICKECSGVHQGLENDVSIVKHVNDSLSPTELALLLQLGNQKVNETLEASTGSNIKPEPKSAYGLKETWIHKKYVEKSFMVEGEQFNSLEGTMHSKFRRDTHQAYQSGACIKRGFMFKQGGSYKNWKRRFFILSESHLSYFKTPNDTTPLGVIQLVLSKAKALTTEAGRPNVIGLITPARTYYLQTDSAPEVKSWVESLTAASRNLSKSRGLTISIPSNFPEPNSTSESSPLKVFHQGYLMKEGNAIVKDWKKRFFILDGDQLSYYRKKGEKEPLGSINITSCNPKVAESRSKKNCIELATPGRSYWVYADDAEEMHTWIRCIQTASQQCLDQMKAPEKTKVPPIVIDSPPPPIKPPKSPCRKIPVTKTISYEECEPSFGSVLGYLDNTPIGSPLMDIHKDEAYSKHGWLTKMGNNVIKDWKPRWIVLKNDKLEYFRARLDGVPAGSILLISAHVKISNNRQHCLEIVTPTRSYWFTANSDDERDEWIEAISSTSQMLMENVLSGKTIINTPAPAQKLDTIQYQGYLQKQGKKGLKPYRQRWAIISSDTLFYYNSDTDSEPLGSINLLLCTVKTTVQGGAYFDVITPSRTYHFLADSKEDMMSWLNRIRDASEKVYNELPTPMAKSSSLSSISDGSIEQTAENLERIKKLLEIYNYCADCNTSNPEWASLNLGIFICIECSGAHRSLGVHISKVRSITLDYWEPAAIEFMENMGNEKSNRLYESSLPESKKPIPSSPRDVKERFIREKYEMLKYTTNKRMSRRIPIKRKPTMESMFKEGYLFEIPPQMRDSLKQRWFLIKLSNTSATLQFYRSETDLTVPAGIIDLLTAAIRPKAIGTTNNSFEIITPSRIYILAATSTKIKQEWMERLETIIGLFDSVDATGKVFADS